MASGNVHRHHTATQQMNTDNSHQEHSEADDKDDESQKQNNFHLEVDESSSRVDVASDSGTTINRFGSNSSCYNNAESDLDREKSTVGWAVGVTESEETVSQTPQHEHEFVGAQSSQDSCRSPPRPIHSVERTISSSLSTVCRPSHSHLVVRCQVNSHDLPSLSSMCPAAFSPVWTKLVQPVLSSSRKSKTPEASDKRRRHTVAGTTSQLPRPHYPHQHPHLHSGSYHDLGAGDGLDPNQSTMQGRGRSLSDSELHHLLVVEVGRELRKMSDEFHCIITGEKLAPVNESTGSEDDSDDEM